MAVLADQDRNIIGLLPGSSEAEYLVGEIPHQAAMFINQFKDVKGYFPKGEF